MKKNELSPRQTWSAVGSMALCVSMLIAAEFMPVSLLTPLARDLRATEGMAGQAISISGLFAVVVHRIYHRSPHRRYFCCQRC
jgi:predicted MFS family arabinose efflux permease